MKLKEVLDKTVQFFKEKKIDTPRLDAEILFSEALGFKQRVDLYLKFDQPLKEEELNLCREFVRRRGGGEPVAYILGKKDFFGHSFHVGQGVLIPRPETELLVERAILWIKENNIQAPRILDLGCGSGCIGFSLAKEVSSSKVICVEKSPEAVKIAKANAAKMELLQQIEILEMDVMDLSFSSKMFDLILSNPPYISENDFQVDSDVKKFEPAMALFSGQDGTQALKEWSVRATPWLKNKSLIGFEMGYMQGTAMKSHFQNLKVFNSVEIVKDLAGHDRHILGVING